MKELAWVLEEYLELALRGEAPEIQVWLDRYPELADDLAPALEALEILHGAGDPKSGQSLGEYRLLREIARGGMGVVYEAEQESLGRRVALKVLPFAAVLDERQLQRFRVEAQAAAHLHHAHIVPVYAVGRDRGVHYYAMQYVEGRSLAELTEELRTDRPNGSSSDPLATLSPGGSHLDRRFARNVARIGADAAGALHYAHEQGVVHRDIKPGNLLLDAQSQVWITDFGLARGRGDQSLTMTGDLIGTLRYMSPEQTRGQPADARSDVYSLGATLYEVLVLRPAFVGDDPQQVLADIGSREPPSIRSLNSTVPEEVETIIAKAMSKEPTERYVSAGELEADLRRFLENRPIVARPPSALDRIAKWTVRHRRALPFAAAGVLLVIVIFAVAVAQVADQRDVARDALAGERGQRTRAERNFQRSMDAVDRLLVTVDEELLRDVPHLERVRRDVLNQALAFQLELLDEAAEDAEVRFEVARTHIRVGRILELLGDAASGDHFAEAIRLLASLNGEDEQLRALARAHFLVGQSERRASRWKMAADALQESLSILDEIRQPVPQDVQAEAEALASRGEALALADKPDDALQALDGSIRAWARVRKTDATDPKARLGELHARQRRAHVRYNHGFDLEAWQSFEQLLPEYEALAEQHGDRPRYRLALARHLGDLANARRSQEKITAALDAQQAAVGAYEALVIDFPAVPSYRIQLIDAYAMLGRIRQRSSDVDGAFRAFDDARRVADTMLARFPETPSVLAAVAKQYSLQGDYYCSVNKRDEGDECRRRAIAILEKLTAICPDVPVYLAGLSWIRLQCAAESKAPWPEREPLYIAAARACREFLDRRPSRQVEFRLSQIVGVQGEGLLRSTDRKREAIALCREAASILERMLEGPAPAHYVRRNLGANRNKIGQILLEVDDPEAALDEFRAALTVMEEVNRNRPNDRETLLNLSLISGNQGTALDRLGESAAAQTMFERELQRMQEALDILPGNIDSIHYLVLAKMRMADRLIGADPARAERICEEIVRLCDAISAKEQTRPRAMTRRAMALARIARIRHEKHNETDRALELLAEAEENQRVALKIAHGNARHRGRLREILEQRVGVLEASGRAEALAETRKDLAAIRTD